MSNKICDLLGCEIFKSFNYSCYPGNCGVMVKVIESIKNTVAKNAKLISWTRLK